MRPADPDRVVLDVGRRIAEARAARQLTQEELAEELGVSIKYLQRVERGQNLSIRSLVQLANALHIHTAELFFEPRSRRRPSGRPRRSK